MCDRYSCRRYLGLWDSHYMNSNMVSEHTEAFFDKPYIVGKLFSRQIQFWRYFFLIFSFSRFFCQLKLEVVVCTPRGISCASGLRFSQTKYHRKVDSELYPNLSSLFAGFLPNFYFFLPKSTMLFLVLFYLPVIQAPCCLISEVLGSDFWAMLLYFFLVSIMYFFQHHGEQQYAPS